MAQPWSREEVEATVADYFSMLETELDGLSIEKTKHRRRLLPLLKNRSESSIEFKHQNISAVLRDLGFPGIRGYLPASNYQGLLRDIVAERLNANQSLIAQVEKDIERIIVVPQLENILEILTDPPKPNASTNHVKEKTPPHYSSPINYLEREAHNQSLGLAGEEFIVNFERARLISKGKETLASKIEHVSKLRGDGNGFDILSFETSGRERLIEVKTTKYGKETPFYVSRNELSVSRSHAEQYHLYRLFAFRDAPRLFTLSGELSSTCVLEPDSYIATVA